MSTNGFDYAGGRPNADQIKAAGGAFVCRYLTDGGPGLPGKQLQQWEVDQFKAAGIGIVANHETTANFMLNGYNAGKADALSRSAFLDGLGLGGAPIYFSADWDTTAADSVVINNYLRGVCDAIGVERSGIYGGYWTVKRAFDAGVVTYGWQTSAWSGGQLDPRAHIYQNMNLGYRYIAGVPCDQNVALKPNYGQWNAAPPVNLIEQAAEIAKDWIGARLAADGVEGETVCPDGRGRFVPYENAHVYWAGPPADKAYVVPHGGLFEAWKERGYEAGPMGYPIQDFARLPGGGVQCFGGRTGTDPQVLYVPNDQLAGFDVHGEILKAYASQGYETGPLGFVTSDEAPVPNTDNIVQHFTGGDMKWSPSGVITELKG